MRHLTITAAAAAILAAASPAAFAQGAGSAAGSSAMAPAATATPATTATADGDTFYQTTQTGFTLASNWIGTDVRGSAGENVGEIKDVIVGPDGKVAAAVVSVGGFLGIGEKDVAVNLAALSAGAERGNGRVLMIDTTKEALEAAPAFVEPETETALLAPGAGDMGSDPVATGSTTMAPADADSGMTSMSPAPMAPADGAMGSTGSMGATGAATTQ